MSDATMDSLEAARQALGAGAWPEAVAAFRDLIALSPDCAEACEGLGMAAWWLDDQETVLEARERAFRLYRAAGEPLAAARVATFLALDHADYRGDLAVSSGWQSRAERLLAGLPPAPEHARLKLYQGFMTLMFLGDLATARDLHAEGVMLASAVSDFDLQMMGLALEGLICLR